MGAVEVRPQVDRAAAGTASTISTERSATIEGEEGLSCWLRCRLLIPQRVMEEVCLVGGPGEPGVVERRVGVLGGWVRRLPDRSFGGG